MACRVATPRSSTRPMSDSQLQVLNQSDTDTLFHGLIHVVLRTCTIPAPVGPATSFSSRSFPHQRNYIGSYVFCVDEITTWRPTDHCGHWFRQTWLLKSFNTIDAMVAKPVRVVTMKFCKTLYRGLGDGCTGDQVFLPTVNSQVKCLLRDAAYACILSPA